MWPQKMTSQLPCYSTVDVVAVGWMMTHWSSCDDIHCAGDSPMDSIVWIEQSTIKEQEEKAKTYIALTMSQRSMFFELNNWSRKERRENIYHIMLLRGRCSLNFIDDGNKKEENKEGWIKKTCSTFSFGMQSTLNKSDIIYRC